MNQTQILKIFFRTQICFTFGLECLWFHSPMKELGIIFFASEKGQTHNFYVIFFNPFFTFENSLTVPQSSRFTTLS